MFTTILNFLLAISDFIWSYPLIILTVLVAVSFSVGTGFFQFTYLGPIFKHTFGNMFNAKASENGISPFAAVCSALANTLGVGNIAGVAVAISLGGPGAVFWMWIVAILGMIVKYGEIALAIKYREVDPDTGLYKGGIMYYAKNGLGKQWAWVGAAWCAVIAAVEILAPAVQINSLAGALTTYFEINPLYIGIACAIAIGAVLLGGLKRISQFATMVVPFMAIAYTVVALFVIFVNIQSVPAAFALIFTRAFTGTAATGGFAGATIAMSIRWGVARGIYSNEAGNGLAPIVHSTANVDHPAKQAIWGVVEVFIDTIIVCTMTALVVVVTGVWDTGEAGATLTTMGFAAGIGNETAAGIFVSVVIFFFAFTTATVSVFYGQSCLACFIRNKGVLTAYALLSSLMAIVGAVGGLSAIWGLADLGLGIGTLLNLVVIFMLRKDVYQITKEYKDMLKKGEA